MGTVGNFTHKDETRMITIYTITHLSELKAIRIDLVGWPVEQRHVPKMIAPA